MNIVSQVVTALEAGLKISWPIFAASVAVTAVEHLYPEFYEGAPSWLLPSIHVIGVITGVLSLLQGCKAAAGIARRSLARIFIPFRKAKVQKRLLGLNVYELAVLSEALARQDRNLRRNPNAPQILSMQDKGLIEPAYTLVGFADNLSSFVIPEDVWRVLLSLEEFRMEDPAKLRQIFSTGEVAREDQIIGLLPKSHPSVMSKTREKANRTV